MFLSSAYSSWWSFNLGFVQKAVHWISCPAWSVFVSCLWSPDITAVWGRLRLNLWPDVDASSRNQRCIFQVIACVPERPGSTSFPIWLSWGAGEWVGPCCCDVFEGHLSLLGLGWHKETRPWSRALQVLSWLSSAAKCSPTEKLKKKWTKYPHAKKENTM